MFAVGLIEEAADSVWGNGEGDPRRHFQGVDADHLAILTHTHTVFNPFEKLKKLQTWAEIECANITLLLKWVYTMKYTALFSYFFSFLTDVNVFQSLNVFIYNCFMQQVCNWYVYRYFKSSQF